MIKTKPSIPKGTRDFTPAEMYRRNFIFNTIREVFEIYGYMPIETPAIENLTTLLGKYGEEGDRLLFKILNSGDYLSKVKEKDFQEKKLNEVTGSISEKGLRYDLTVPFARFVVQNRNDLTFPFKRYQVQPVWRADKPQKGRYREFYQCDVDVIGSDSLLNEVELILIIEEVFKRLNINVNIRLNNRKILSGIAEYMDESLKFTDITVAIDKLDKIGADGVTRELKDKGISPEGIQKLQPFLEFDGDLEQRLGFLSEKLKDSEMGMKGVEEFLAIHRYLKDLGKEDLCELDLTLARGLNYYTGSIIEVNAGDMKIGSICGGGRYDDLTGIFGLPDVSGVGISFGADRIYDVMNNLGLFPGGSAVSTEVLLINFGGEEEKFALQKSANLRLKGVKAELYPEPAKLKKQMKYADQKSIPYVVMAGSEEIKKGFLTVKNMQSGEQDKVKSDDLSEFILEKLIHQPK